MLDVPPRAYATAVSLSWVTLTTSSTISNSLASPAYNATSGATFPRQSDYRIFFNISIFSVNFQTIIEVQLNNSDANTAFY